MYVSNLYNINIPDVGVPDVVADHENGKDEQNVISLMDDQHDTHHVHTHHELLEILKHY